MHVEVGDELDCAVERLAGQSRGGRLRFSVDPSLTPAPLPKGEGLVGHCRFLDYGQTMIGGGAESSAAGLSACSRA
jgi:hypothetical protein